MANEKNLIPFEELTEAEHRKIASKGGKASVESRRRKKALKECLQELLQMEYDTKQGKKLGSEMLSAMLMKKAMNGDIKAFEVLRDTAGEKPVDKVMVADVDPEIVDEVERLVNDE